MITTLDTTGLPFPETYANPRYTSDHTAVLGAWGMVLSPAGAERAMMSAALDRILNNWYRDTTNSTSALT